MSKKRSQGWGASSGSKKSRKAKPAAKPRTEVKPRGKVVHRVNVVKANGSLPESREVAPGDDDIRVSIGEAMRRAVEELGEVVVDDKLAPSQLRQLAEYYEDVTRAQAAFSEKSEAAKLAKKSLDSATNLLLERVRAFTHPAPLPLFDQPQAEEDLNTMLDGIDGASDAASADA